MNLDILRLLCAQLSISAGPYVINPAYHVYFTGIDFSYTEFNEEFENLCLKIFPTFRHRQF